MTRKLLVRVLAVIYLALGIWELAAAFAPLFIHSASHDLSLVKVLVGGLELWAGIYLLRFSEFGRRYTIVLAALGIALNLLSACWAVYVLQQKAAGLAVKILGRQYLGADAFYILVFIMVFLILAWSLALLGVILFLSQQETKALFREEG